MPLLPAVMLRQRLPLLAVWLSSLALWSLWPLLCRDGLIAPVILLGAGYAVAFWPSAEAVEQGDAVLVTRTLEVLESSCLGCRKSHVPKSRIMALLLLRCAAASALPALAISVTAAILPPPARLPDAYPFATAVYACVLLLSTWAMCSWILLSGVIVARTSTNSKI